jgi:acetate kinase
MAVLRDRRATLAELEDVLDHRSGLLGVSGRSADVRELLAAEVAGDDEASLALEMFTRRAAAGIAAAATCLPSVDAIVFTGGIGENSAVIRARIASRLGTLAVPSIPIRDVAEDRVLAAASGATAVLRIESREDIVIAEAVRSVLW